MVDHQSGECDFIGYLTRNTQHTTQSPDEDTDLFLVSPSVALQATRPLNLCDLLVIVSLCLSWTSDTLPVSE